MGRRACGLVGYFDWSGHACWGCPAAGLAGQGQHVHLIAVMLRIEDGPGRHPVFPAMIKGGAA